MCRKSLLQACEDPSSCSEGGIEALPSTLSPREREELVEIIRDRSAHICTYHLLKAAGLRVRGVVVPQEARGYGSLGGSVARARAERSYAMLKELEAR